MAGLTTFRGLKVFCFSDVFTLTGFGLGASEISGAGFGAITTVSFITGFSSTGLGVGVSGLTMTFSVDFDAGDTFGAGDAFGADGAFGLGKATKFTLMMRGSNRFERVCPGVKTTTAKKAKWHTIEITNMVKNGARSPSIC